MIPAASRALAVLLADEQEELGDQPAPAFGVVGPEHRRTKSMIHGRHASPIVGL
jgi:hypothetical protein